MSLDAAVEADDVQRVQELVERGSQISPPSQVSQKYSDDSVSTRSRAASRGLADMLKLLFTPSRDAPFSEEQVTTDRKLCVRRAAQAGHLEAMQIILSDERILEEELKDLNSASLIAAAEAGHNHIVQYNLQHKADAHVVNYISEDPIMLACTAGYDKVVRSLLEAGVKAANRAPCGRLEYNNLWRAAVKGHTAVMQLLLDHGADEQIGDITMGVLVMRGAGEAGQLDSMQLLFDNGVKINEVHGKDIEKRLLRKGNHDALELLKRNGVDVDVDAKEQGGE